MKHVVSLTILLAVGSLFTLPDSASAVDVIETGGYSSTTTTIDNYPRNDSFYGSGNNYDRNRRDRRQPQVIIIQQNNGYYPSSNRSNCSTTIIGSPIPSPIPLDRSTGQPCR